MNPERVGWSWAVVLAFATGCGAKAVGVAHGDEPGFDAQGDPSPSVGWDDSGPTSELPPEAAPARPPPTATSPAVPPEATPDPSVVPAVEAPALPVSEPPLPEMLTVAVAQWGTVHHDEVTDLAIDPDDNAVIVGMTMVGSSDPGAEDRALFVRKLDPEGAVLWELQESDYERSVDLQPSVAVDVNGDVLVAISVTPGGKRPEARLTRLDPDGAELWTTVWGTSGIDSVYDVALDGQGNAYVGGGTEGEFDGANQGRDDAFISRVDRQGDVQWTRQWGSAGSDSVSRLLVDADGNLLVATRAGHAFGALDAHLTNFDPEGNELWSQHWETEGDADIYALTTDSLGNVFVGGGRTPDPDDASVSEAGFIAKLTSDGVLTWSQLVDGWVTALTTDSLNRIAIGIVEYSPRVGSVALWDTEATPLWRTYFRPDGRTVITGLKAASDDQLVVAGYTGGVMTGENAGRDDAFVLRLAHDDVP